MSIFRRFFVYYSLHPGCCCKHFCILPNWSNAFYLYHTPVGRSISRKGRLRATAYIMLTAATDMLKISSGRLVGIFGILSMYLAVLRSKNSRSKGSRKTARALKRTACQTSSLRSASIARNIPHPGQKRPDSASTGHGIPAPVAEYTALRSKSINRSNTHKATAHRMRCLLVGLFMICLI